MNLQSFNLTKIQDSSRRHVEFNDGKKCSQEWRRMTSLICKSNLVRISRTVPETWIFSTK